MFDDSVQPGRVRAILNTSAKWANGTVLRYYFFTSPTAWRGTDAHKKLVRDAFKAWKNVGIGLDFKEVTNPGESDIRVGFLRDDGHWSYLGRQILDQGESERTMNLDKGDNWGIDTAIHEIGHTLGLPHEHQNPNAGIVWNEQAVIADLAGSPNFWSEETTRWNILRKIPADTVQGSNWDPDSIMHYEFKAGLINMPTKYQTQALIPAPGLSERDKTWVKHFYPPLQPSTDKLLKPFESVQLALLPAEQANFVIRPTSSRMYKLQTFGTSDTVMVLFEDVNGELQFVAGDDDSGVDTNSALEVRLHAGKEYRLRLRLYFAESHGNLAVMMW